MPTPFEQVLEILGRIEAKIDSLVACLCDCPECIELGDHHIEACLGKGGGHGHHTH